MAFANQPEGESSRTVDVIKSIEMLLIQFYTLLQVKDHVDWQIEGAHLDVIKLRFVRFFIEETLRRN